MSETATTPGSLSGVRVGDVWNFLADPYDASFLGELDAAVIKVEHPTGGDPVRRNGTLTVREDASVKWRSEAHNRKSVTIDLRQSEGVARFLRLPAKSDVLVEDPRPGTMETWEPGWQQVLEVDPRLVMLRISGQGQAGSYRRRSPDSFASPAFRATPRCSRRGATRRLHRQPAWGRRCADDDVAPRRHRSRAVGRSGNLRGVFRILAEIARAYALSETIHEREGSGSFVAAPHGHFRAKDNKRIAIACTTDTPFVRLPEVMATCLGHEAPAGPLGGPRDLT